MWNRPLGLALAACLLVPTLAQAAEPVQLTTSPAPDRFPDWSPDGKFIAFESTRTGHSRIWRISPQGDDLEQLTFGPGEDRFPDVSPDGSLIVFTRIDGDEEGLLFTVPSAGGTATQLNEPVLPLDQAVQPDWSPDGSTVYFSRRPGDDFERWDIWYVPATGGKGQPFFVDPGYSSAPLVTPDGLRVGIQQQVDGDHFYSLVEASISNPEDWRRLTFPVHNSLGGFAYSPDERHALLGSREHDPRGWTEIWEIDLKTLELTQVTFDIPGNNYSPEHNDACYSPNGTMIVYSARRNNGNHDLWLLDLEREPVLENRLIVEDGTGVAEGGPIRVPISLENTVPARGIELKIQDHPDHTEVKGVEAVGRAEGMTTSWTDTGELHLLLFDEGGQSIPAGTGHVLNLLVQIGGEAERGDRITMAADEALLSTALETFTVPAEDGTIHVELRPGDLNEDNLVDTGDLVRLVEIILGIGDPPDEDELEAADCNGDEEINIGDVTCLVDLVLEDASAPSAPSDAFTVPILVRSETDVKGLEVLLPEAGRIEAGPGLHPLRLHAGNRKVVAFDPAGGGWSPGDRVPFLASAGSDPHDFEFHAYGPGGIRLPVTVEGNEVRIGVTDGPRLQVLPLRPNPFRGSTTIRFRLDAPSHVALSVFDLRGARVADVPERAYPAGESTITWQAVDEAGRRLAMGVYFARLTLSGTGVSKTIRMVHLGE